VVAVTRIGKDRVVVFDTQLADRVRSAVAERSDCDEKKMFGGLAFMVNTHMACGMIGDDLMVRVGPDGHDDALGRGATEMQFTGRPMRGMVIVPAALLTADDDLYAWIDRAVTFARSQPAKPPKKPHGKT